jgi:hypothetical protein
MSCNAFTPIFIQLSFTAVKGTGNLGKNIYFDHSGICLLEFYDRAMMMIMITEEIFNLMWTMNHSGSVVPPHSQNTDFVKSKLWERQAVEPSRPQGPVYMHLIHFLHHVEFCTVNLFIFHSQSKHRTTSYAHDNSQRNKMMWKKAEK